MLTVYSKNNCANCVKLKKQLTLWNVEFDEVNIEENMDARNWLVDQGHRSAPVLYHDMRHIPHTELTLNILQQIIGGS